MRAGTFGSFSNSRYNNFNFLRFALATLVVFSHSFPLLLGAKGFEPLDFLTRGQLKGGDLAVNLFFVISGYLIAKSWLQSNGVGEFLTKRVQRIYPGFAVALAFCVFVVGPIAVGFHHLGGYFRSHEAIYFFRPLLMLPGSALPHVFVTNPFPLSVNGSLWTIRFEFGCYLMVALLGVLGFMRSRGTVLGLFVAALVIYQVQQILHHPVNNSATLAHLPRFIAYYLSGSVFYLYRNETPYRRTWAIASVALLAIGCLGGLSFLVPTVGAYLLFYFAFNPEIKLQEFGASGDVSYGIYLYAYPVQQLLVHFFGTALNPATLFVSAMPITFGLAVLSWRYVERPFLIRKRQQAAVRTMEAAPVAA